MSNTKEHSKVVKKENTSTVIAFHLSIGEIVPRLY
jgi:hypothetical protein